MNGIILVNKEKDYTSHDIVAIAKKTLGEKIGHTGTLDPIAKGVLPLLIGDATKIAKYITNHDKIYVATLKLGIKTDTQDITGKVLETYEVQMPKKEKIEEVFSSMKGKQKQIPPMYSAIKVNGKKLYEYARKGKTIELEPRDIEIYSLELNNINKCKNEITFTIHCSKGTYIRTVCEQIASKVETIGCMSALNRTQVGEFKLEDCIEISDLKQNKEKVINNIITIEQFFKNKNEIMLENKELEQFLNGVKLKYNLKDGIYRIYNQNRFIGVGIISNKYLKRDVVIKNSIN